MPRRNIFFAKVFFTSPKVVTKSELIRRSEWQATFAIEKSFQPPILGTAFAPDNTGCDALAQFTAISPSFHPVFPTDGAFNREDRKSVV